MSGTISIVVLRAVIAMLEEQGVDPLPLLEQHGIERELLGDAETRIDARAMFRLIESMPGLVHDELFCFRAAHAVPPGALDVFDFALRASATMGECLERMVRYYALVDDRTELRIERRGSTARLIGKNRTTPPAPRAATELLFGLVVARGEQLCGEPCPLLSVSFLKEAPADPGSYEQYLGAPVKFSQTRDELAFRATWLDAVCRAHDPALAEFFDRYAQKYLEKVTGPATFVDSVSRAVAEGLREAEPTLASAARRLGTSERTLQRRLRESSCSYAELVDTVRHELALDLLRDPALPIAEVGYLLRFADTSAFYRAFKRWTGSTPADYRRQPTLVRGSRGR